LPCRSRPKRFETTARSRQGTQRVIELANLPVYFLLSDPIEEQMTGNTVKDLENDVHRRDRQSQQQAVEKNFVKADFHAQDCV